MINKELSPNSITKLYGVHPKLVSLMHEAIKQSPHTYARQNIKMNYINKVELNQVRLLPILTGITVNQTIKLNQMV